jgi:hypothetical protein
MRAENQTGRGQWLLSKSQSFKGQALCNSPLIRCDIFPDSGTFPPVRSHRPPLSFQSNRPVVMTKSRSNLTFSAHAIRRRALVGPFSRSLPTGRTNQKTLTLLVRSEIKRPVQDPCRSRVREGRPRQRHVRRCLISAVALTIASLAHVGHRFSALAHAGGFGILAGRGQIDPFRGELT